MKHCTILSFSLPITPLLVLACGSDGTTPTTGPMDEPVLSLSSPDLTFDPGVGELAISITNTGSGTLSWSVSENPETAWLSVSPSSGTNDGNVSVTVAPVAASPGTHAASLSFTSNGGSSEVSVTLHVSGLSTSVENLSFATDESVKTFEITNSGSGNLDWEISVDPGATWLNVAPRSGSNDGVITVSVDRSLTPDIAGSSELVLTSTGGGATIPVSFVDFPSGTFFSDDFEMPLSGWGVSNGTAEVLDGKLELWARFRGFEARVQKAFIDDPVPAPWAVRSSFGRRGIDSDGRSALGVQISDSGFPSLSAIRILILDDPTRNWAVQGFLVSPIFQGWANLDSIAQGNSELIDQSDVV